MKRRDFPLALLALAACGKATTDPPAVEVPVTMGVSVCPIWENPRGEYGKVPGTQCPWQYPWENLATDDRVPLLGQYNEALPGITEKRLEWMEYAGIGFACYQVELKMAA
jgi:hypothetical protein